MRTSIAAATMAASLTLGGVAGVALFSPTLTGAQTDDAGAVDTATDPERPRLESWVTDAVQPLVPGTIDQGQADAVVDAVVAAAPERPHRGGHLGPRGELGEAVAEVLDLTPEELREQLATGATLGEVADAQGVDRAAVVDAIVASITEHLQEAVDAGRLNQEQADERLADVDARAQQVLERSFDGEGPRGRFGHGPHGRGGPFGPGAGSDTAGS